MHYLQHFGLSNAKVFIYRRVQAERPLTRLNTPCGIEIVERLLLPNRGLEASAFYDYVLEHYQSPPKAVMLLHGHGTTLCAQFAARPCNVQYCLCFGVRLIGNNKHQTWQLSCLTHWRQTPGSWTFGLSKTA